MRKLLAGVLLAVGSFSVLYAQQEHKHGEQSIMPMMPMMMSMMMEDPEMRKAMMEHMQKCRQQMMNTLMENPRFMERLISTMLQHRETMKKVLENNPQMKKQMEELLK